MKIYNVAIAMLIAVLVLSCNKGNNTSSENASLDIQLEDVKMKTENSRNVVADTTATVSGGNSSNALNAGDPAKSPDWDKNIIKTANVTLELKDYKSYNNSLHKNVKTYGAYISNEQQLQTDDRIGNTIAIKVPVHKFEDLMNSFVGEGVKVIERQISTEDVTGEVVDTKARIEAKKEIRARYLDLLKQAKNMKEILEVQKEINAIQEDLESADGRVNYLVHRSAYSTIHLNYYQYLNGATSSEPTFFTRLQEAFRNGSSIITGFLLFVVTIWPVLLTSVLALIILKKYQLKKLALTKK